ncbi:hypothetical protein Ahy_B05g075396 [Arachis hypogaea]|uniref:CCHC-type domain-containing protein n=1 Tax=Arachis hypogaea TaxID=3818 RepID=A0A444Z137_ARAHY|nr:hypothetical protein Ahy_B05g075396 [Arachis hypogaea]
MPISNPCSSKPKNNKSEKSIPPTTTKKSETSVKKNSKSTPKKASRFAPKGKKVVGEVPSVTLSSDSSDSYESVEDELYRPGPEAFESSSDDESDSEVATARPRELKMKKNKAKGKICLEDLCEEDELIVQNSDEEVDLGQVIGKAPEVQPPYDAFDAYHDDSDGNDSPQAPKIRWKPGPLKQKRRKDADEEPSGSKKSKTDATKLPRKYKEFSCAYCGTKGHTKRSCSHRKADDIAAALAATAAAVIAKEKQKGANAATNVATSAAAGVATSSTTGVATSAATNVATSAAPTNAPSEIVLSQTHFSQPDNGDQEQVTPATRPDKLQPKRKAFPAPGSSSVDPLQGASAGTSSMMAEFMKFVPTPGVKPAFKPPRKK